MRVRRWIGLAVNALFGLLFPYVLAGTVILVHGFMAPSGPVDKMIGGAIAVLYLGVLAALNWSLIRSERGAARWKTLAACAAVWIGVSIVSVYMAGRFGGLFPS